METGEFSRRIMRSELTAAHPQLPRDETEPHGLDPEGLLRHGHDESMDMDPVSEDDLSRVENQHILSDTDGEESAPSHPAALVPHTGTLQYKDCLLYTSPSPRD